MKFSELQQQLKEKLGIDRLADIARELGVSPQAVSNWKARDRVPYKYVSKMRNHLEKIDLSGDNKINTQVDQQIELSMTKKSIDANNRIDLLEIINGLAKNFRFIIMTSMLFCILMVIYVQYFAKPLYVTTAKIMSSTIKASTSGLSQVAGGFAAQLGINLPSGNTDSQWIYPEVIKSRTLSRSLLERKFDTNKYGRQKKLLQILTKGYVGYEIGKDTLEIIAINSLQNMIAVEENVRRGIFTLKISAFEPQLAKDIATVLIEELDSHQREYNNSRISETRQFIEQRVEATEIELEAAEENLKDFRDRNRRIENSPALQLKIQRLTRETSVLTGVFTSLKQHLENTKIEEVRKSDYIVVLDPPEIPLTRTKPQKRLLVVLAIILGILLGIFMVIIKILVEDSEDETKKKIIEIKTSMMQNIIVLNPFNKVFKS